MSIDINTETSLEIAEKLMYQEHVINVKRIEVLSQIVIKLVERFPELKDEVEEELKVLERLERRMEDLDDASRGFLSVSDSHMIVFE